MRPSWRPIWRHVGSKIEFKTTSKLRWILDGILRRLGPILEAKLGPCWPPNREPNGIWPNLKKRTKTKQFSCFLGFQGVREAMKNRIKLMSKKTYPKRSVSGAILVHLGDQVGVQVGGKLAQKTDRR